MSVATAGLSEQQLRPKLEFNNFLKKLDTEFGSYLTGDRRFFGKELDEIESTIKDISLSESERKAFDEIQSRAKQYTECYTFMLNHHCDDPAELPKFEHNKQLFRILLSDLVEFDTLLAKKATALADKDDEDCPTTPKLESSDASELCFYNFSLTPENADAQIETKEEEENAKLYEGLTEEQLTVDQLPPEQALSPEWPRNPDFDSFLGVMSARFGRYCTKDGRFLGIEIDQLAIKLNDTSIEVSADEIEKMRNIEIRSKKLSEWYDWIFNHRCDDPEKFAILKKIKPWFSKFQSDIRKFDELITARKPASPLTYMHDQNQKSAGKLKLTAQDRKRKR